MEKLRMAIIGSGQIAQVTHIPHYQSMEKVEIVGICDTRLEAARSVADKFHIAHYYGSANVYHYVKDGKDMLVSTNREIDEVALYKITEE